jgi:hypothetical protein
MGYGSDRQFYIFNLMEVRDAQKKFRIITCLVSFSFSDSHESNPVIISSLY